jgi:hypothetical protein
LPTQNIKTQLPIKVEKHGSTRLHKIVIIVLAVLLLATSFMAFSSTTGMVTSDQSKVNRNVLDLYKLITGKDAEIVKTSDQSGVYKISVRFTDSTGRDTIQDIFVTKDGSYFTDRLVDLVAQTSLLQNQSAFAQCLVEKQVRIVGPSNDNQTIAQIQLLGAFAATGNIYLDCNSDIYRTACQQLNTTQFPVIFVGNNPTAQGPQNLDWFETNVGCYMTKDAKKQ